MQVWVSEVTSTTKTAQRCNPTICTPEAYMTVIQTSNNVIAACCHHLAVGVHDEQQELAVCGSAPRGADPPGVAVAPVVP